MSTSAITASVEQPRPISMRLLRRHWLLIGALAVGLLARVPGIFWGINYPTGWVSHHIDEYTHLRVAGCLVNPAAQDAGGHPVFPAGCSSHYPRGMAAHVALPLLAMRAVQGSLTGPLPTPAVFILTGRAITVLYGVATILVVFLLARMFFKDRPAVPYLSAWILALSGLHVTQSHFFLADVPALFWMLLGLYLVGRHMEGGPTAMPHYLNAAALCLGMAFGFKLCIAALPSLVIAGFLSRRGGREREVATDGGAALRITRLLYVGVFFLAGFCLASMDAYSPYEVYRTLRTSAVHGPLNYHFSRLAGAAIYLLEMPSLVSLPVTLLAAWGTILLGRRLYRRRAGSAMRLIVLIFLLPTAITLWVVLFRTDNFPRHLLPFIPWAAVASAWGLSRFGELLAGMRVRREWVVIPVFLYLGVFVFDGERIFWKDPRNLAERWLLDNVPKQTRVSWIGAALPSSFAHIGYTYSPYLGTPPPDVIVGEMHYANFFLSGMGLRNSYPADASTVWPWFSAPGALSAWQALFKGTSPYTQCARFPEGYIMPEYIWTDRWIGNRSRNYVAEVVIFRRADGSGSPLVSKTPGQGAGQ